MILTTYLVGVASNYTVHMIFTSYEVGVAYDYTVYHFEHEKVFPPLRDLCYT